MHEWYRYNMHDYHSLVIVRTNNLTQMCMHDYLAQVNVKNWQCMMCMHDCQFNIHLVFKQTTKLEISMHDCWLNDFIDL